MHLKIGSITGKIQNVGTVNSDNCIPTAFLPYPNQGIQWVCYGYTVEIVNMVKIRLLRTGKKKQPSYRIVAADSRTKRDGKTLEILGFYNPLTNPSEVKIKKGRYDYWISVGAQPTETVRNLVNKLKSV